MYIVKAYCKDGYAVQERNAWMQSEVDFCKFELGAMFPECEIKVEEYVPWTKERAEQEIKERQKKEKKSKKKEEA